MNIDRDLYLKQIHSLLDSEQIKVITGIRRCGKSYLLNLIYKALKEDGIKGDHIIKISMEDLNFKDLMDRDACHQYIIDKIKDEDKYYVLIDEVQLIHNWEQVVNSIRLRNTSIIITGSNSKILSGELATLLAGRYVEFRLRTISFAEYFNSLKKINPNADMRKSFDHYVMVGSYPIILSSSGDISEMSYSIVGDIYNSTVYKDVINRNKIRNDTLLIDVINYLFDNIGNLISIKKIVNYLNSNGKETNIPTISSYIEALERAFVLEKVPRYDLRGKAILSSVDKYYVADHSLMYVNRGYSIKYIAQIMENIVYNDLRRRGYRVFVGKVGDKEIDFIAEKANSKVYIQVSYMMSKDTLEREIEPLKKIRDSYNKYIVTMDPMAGGNENGIKFVYLPEFLLREEI